MSRSGRAIRLWLSTAMLAGCFGLPAPAPAPPASCDGGLCAIPSDFGAPCQAASDCTSSICLPDGAGTNRCSAQCRSASDCPSSWQCSSGACECGGALCGDICIDLTSDPLNCGACGHVCSADPDSIPFCTEGTCAETLSTPENTLVFGLAAGSGYVCWTDGSSLFVVSYTGVSEAAPASGGNGPIVDLSIEGPWLLWGSEEDFMSISGAMLPSGLTDIALGAEQIARTGLASMVTDANNVYWVDENPSPGLFQTSITGGEIISLATSPAPPIGLTVQGPLLYWALPDGNILSVPVGGGQPASLLGVGPPNGDRITSDSQSVYVVDTTSTLVIAVSIQGGTATTVVSGSAVINDLLSDGTNLYWSEPSQGLLMRVPVSGGNPTVIASNQTSPTFLAIDGVDDFLYWANEGDGDQNGSGVTSINRMPRK